MTKREAMAKEQDHQAMAERLGYQTEWKAAKRGDEWVLTTAPVNERREIDYGNGCQCGCGESHGEESYE